MGQIKTVALISNVCEEIKVWKQGFESKKKEWIKPPCQTQSHF